MFGTPGLSSVPRLIVHLFYLRTHLQSQAGPRPRSVVAGD